MGGALPVVCVNARPCQFKTDRSHCFYGKVTMESIHDVTKFVENSQFTDHSKLFKKKQVSCDNEKLVIGLETVPSRLVCKLNS